MDTETLRKSSQAHLIGFPPSRRVVMQQLDEAANEIDRLRAMLLDPCKPDRKRAGEPQDGLV